MRHKSELSRIHFEQKIYNPVLQADSRSLTRAEAGFVSRPLGMASQAASLLYPFSANGDCAPTAHFGFRHTRLASLRFRGSSRSLRLKPGMCPRGKRRTRLLFPGLIRIFAPSRGIFPLAVPESADEPMQKLRSHIVSLFLAIYLVATGGSSWTAITCSCAAAHRSATVSHHGHDAYGGHDDVCGTADGGCLACDGEGFSVAAPCCGHLHLNLEMLLVRCCDGERCRQHLACRFLPCELPVAVLAEPCDPLLEAPLRLLSVRRGAPPAPAPHEGCRAVRGLRAPPVTV